MQYYDSLHNIPLDDLANLVGGKNRLTYLVSQRLKQISRGSPLLVDRRENESLLAAVCREVAEKKIWIEVPEEEPTAMEAEDEFAVFDLAEEF